MEKVAVNPSCCLSYHDFAQLGPSQKFPQEKLMSFWILKKNVITSHATDTIDKLLKKGINPTATGVVKNKRKEQLT